MNKLLLVFILTFSLKGISQDQIILKNGDFLNVKVTETEANEIKYSKNGSSYIFKTRDLKSIKYNIARNDSSNSKISNYQDKIFLINGDTISADIEDVTYNLVRYKSKNANNNVIYGFLKTDLQGYEFNGNKTEILPNQNVNSNTSQNRQSSTQQQPINGQTYNNTNSSRTTNYNSVNGSKKLWFIGIKNGLFIPTGEFGEGNIVNFYSLNNIGIYTNKGMAQIGFNFGIEGAYFFHKNVGIIAEYGFTTIRVDNGLDYVPIDLENYNWKVFNFSHGVILKTNDDESFFDFKFLITGNHITSNRFKFIDSPQYQDFKSATLGSIGIILGGDYRFAIANNTTFNIGLDYFLGTNSEYYQEVESRLYFDNSNLSTYYGLLIKNIAVQGVRLNFGISFLFGK